MLDCCWDMSVHSELSCRRDALQRKKRVLGLLFRLKWKKKATGMHHFHMKTAEQTQEHSLITLLPVPAPQHHVSTTTRPHCNVSLPLYTVLINHLKGSGKFQNSSIFSSLTSFLWSDAIISVAEPTDCTQRPSHNRLDMKSCDSLQLR